ncbi:MAG: ROK family protein [Verrucomicrobia bacterium]|nr:ROK family protein [Verrucomicrobiota bacterium]
MRKSEVSRSAKEERAASCPSPRASRLAPRAYVLGIDLGGSSVKAVAVTPSGRALARFNEPFDPKRRMDFAETIRRLVRRVGAERGQPAQRIGLSAPGLAAKDGRSIAFMPGRLRGLVGLIWSEFLRTPSAIPVLNDAHAALLGEVWQGAARRCENVIMITLGTGVGGAAMVDGRLLQGRSGKAGHLGHTCLDLDGPPDVCHMPGSLEMAIGNCSIRERSAGRFETTHDLIAAHVAGDEEATRVWLKSVKALASAIGSFSNILDPEIAVIGGGIARAGAALFEPLVRSVREVEWKTNPSGIKIVPAELGEFAGAFGAAWNAIRIDPTSDSLKR